MIASTCKWAWVSWEPSSTCLIEASEHEAIALKLRILYDPSRSYTGTLTKSQPVCSIHWNAFSKQRTWTPDWQALEVFVQFFFFFPLGVCRSQLCQILRSTTEPETGTTGQQTRSWCPRGSFGWTPKLLNLAAVGLYFYVISFLVSKKDRCTFKHYLIFSDDRFPCRFFLRPVYGV